MTAVRVPRYVWHGKRKQARGIAEKIAGDVFLVRPLIVMGSVSIRTWCEAVATLVLPVSLIIYR